MKYRVNDGQSQVMPAYPTKASGKCKKKITGYCFNTTANLGLAVGCWFSDGWTDVFYADAAPEGTMWDNTLLYLFYNGLDGCIFNRMIRPFASHWPGPPATTSGVPFFIRLNNPNPGNNLPVP